MLYPAHQGQGLTADTGKRGIHTALNFLHPGHLQPGWVHAIHTTGAEQVADLDVCVGGHEAQLQRAAP